MEGGLLGLAVAGLIAGIFVGRLLPRWAALILTRLGLACAALGVLGFFSPWLGLTRFLDTYALGLATLVLVAVGAAALPAGLVGLLVSRHASRPS